MLIKKYFPPTWLAKTFIHLASLLPLANLYWLAYFDELGGDPVKEVIHFTGIGALNLLLLSLILTPLAKVLKQGKLIQLRRVIGLYAFFYGLLHILNFLFFEVQFDFSLFIDEIFDRPYITVGMTALLILTALAVTSIGFIRRKMGRNWQKLHNLTYLAGALVVIHFFWSVKSELTSPLMYIAFFLFLLYLRKDKFRRWIK
ncbi:protein-methionine-sulfoxide reductase heme-binding subunit MsrQ [Pseudocolwellia sp. AS88]|uniref:protein-methionine-sulfoxide reductase heme-binding subunit MsrQ n=1 Tax=Pseudocolwellia sp. AS88 TaxID=3063958 RepID=UPI0026F1D97B|nr:protein-methionine-sulfoxide reductase heme-binding subunit MsrQ [Pseudocolwellia sp. AS88]MDO7086130.1 protein-methionine-sulfoxide reductase heme-binding subunit MsrQ [Pseudocolwellia sp. AS88]